MYHFVQRRLVQAIRPDFPHLAYVDNQMLRYRIGINPFACFGSVYFQCSRLWGGV